MQRKGREMIESYYAERIENAIQTTYESIAPDLGKVCLQDAVELTLDADRVDMYDGDDDAVEQFKKLTYSQKKLIAFKALRSYF